MNLGDSENKNRGVEFFYLSLNFLSEAVEKFLMASILIKFMRGNLICLMSKKILNLKDL